MTLVFEENYTSLRAMNFEYGLFENEKIFHKWSMFAGNKYMWMFTDNNLIILNLPFLVIWYSVTIFSDYYVASEVIVDTHVF